MLTFRFSCVFVFAAMIGLLTSSARAETVFGCTGSALQSFDTRTPGTLGALIPITGLQGGETIMAIDFRPSTGVLYGLGNTSRLYTINTTTGAATEVGTGPFSPPISGTRADIDFNPTVDRIRVVTSADQNFRLNPNNGTVAGSDTNVTSSATIIGVGYDRNYSGATQTTLFGIDFATDSLVTIGSVNGTTSPNGGVVNSVGSLGFTTAATVSLMGLDSSGPFMYLLANPSGGVTSLYTVNTSTGAATLVAAIPSDPTYVSFAVVPSSVTIVDTTSGSGFASGSISVSGERDYFAFTAPANARVWATLDPGTARYNATASRDTLLRLFDLNFNTQLEFDDDDGVANGEDDNGEGGAAASVIAGSPLVTAGTYFFGVEDFGNNNIVTPYKITIHVSNSSPAAEAEPNNSTATANAIGTISGTTLRSGQINPGGDKDYYAVQANAGDVLFVAVDGDPERDNTDTNIAVQLLSPDPFNEILLSVDSSGSTTGNNIAEGFAFMVPRSGTYFVLVQGSDNVLTGNYDILVRTTRNSGFKAEVEPNDTFSTAQALNLSSAGPVIVGGAILTAGDKDFYSFTAPAGARVWAYVDSGGPLNQSTGVSRNSVLTLLDVNGTSELEMDDDNGTGNGGDDDDNNNTIASVIAGRVLTTAGTYYLRVEEKDNDQPLDPYRLFVFVSTNTDALEAEPNDTPATAQVIGNGAAPLYSGAINVAGDIDYYAVDCTAEDILFIAADCDLDRDQTGTDIVLRLYAPDGTTQIISPASGINGSGTSPIPGEGFNYRIVESGRFYISVQNGSSQATGTYRLMVARTGKGSADLAITQVASNNVVGVGTPITYTYTITNNGPETATNVVVSGSIPTNTTFGTLTVDAGLTAATVVNGVISVTATSMAPGETKNIVLTVTPTVVDVTSSLTISASSADYVAGNNTTSLHLTDNAPPSITSAATATPNPSFAGQPITFAVAATDPTNDALTYTWDFGDGTSGSGASVSKTYTVVNTYTVTVTVTDIAGGTAKSIISMVVLPAGVSGGIDTDGDGFSDEIETLAGTNPTSQLSTPFGGSPAGSAALLTVSKMQIKLNFAKPLSDSISLSGVIAVQAGFTPANKQAIVDVGGVIKVINLDAKGKSPKGDASFKSGIKAKKGVVEAQDAKFSFKASKGSFQAALADELLTGEADLKAVTRQVLVTVFFGGVFQKFQVQLYTVKAGKSGSTKTPKQ